MAPALGSDQYFVYVLTNRTRSTLYVGVTRDLARRMYEHKHKLTPGFTSRYNATRLVHFETTSDVRSAIAREKQLKTWTREKKVALIQNSNPMWKDLSAGWTGGRLQRGGMPSTTVSSVVPPSE